MSSEHANSVRGERFLLGGVWITPGANEIGGVRVEAKSIEVLVALVEAAPDVLSAAMLLDRVWPNVVVVDNVVYQAIAQLRKALGDDARAPRYIENVPRRGYRLIAQVTCDAPATNMAEVAPLLRPRHNLPAQLTSFIGRERELAEVGDLLAAHRLVTLTGVGGCGKTRLALAIAHAQLADFPDGVWLVELAPLTDPEQVTSTLARTLGLRETRGELLTDRLREVLADKHLLLLLDNCEHVIDACAALTESLLTHAPNLRVLATSREALGIGGERPWRTQSLAMPDAREVPPLEQLGDIESVRLFVERAQTLSADFSLTTQNAAAVAQICRRLDGIPLAIELAAALVRAMPVEQIATRLAESFRLLTGGNRTALPRQRTLLATLDWSYQLLSPDARVLLDRLSVFANGFTLAAAEATCGDAPLAARQVFELLTALVDQSMVQQQLPSTHGETRYRLLETVRQYGEERLNETGVASTVCDRHRDYFVALAEELAQDLHGSSRSTGVFPRFLAEHDNFDLALAWCLEGDAEKGLRLATSLAPLWGPLNQWESLHWIQDFLAITSPLAPMRAMALCHAGIAARELGDLERSVTLLEQSIALADADARAAARARTELAANLMEAGETVAAEQLHAAALTIARSGGNPRVLGDCLLRIASTVFRLHKAHDFNSVRALQTESAALFRRTGDVAGLVGVLDLLAEGEATGTGQFSASRAPLEEKLALARLHGNPRWIGNALMDLGLLAELEGEDLQGTRLMQEALGADARLDPDDAATQISMGRLLLKIGDRDRAMQMLRRGLLWASNGIRIGNGRRFNRWCVISLYAFALDACIQHEYARAARLHGAALRMRRGARLRDGDATKPMRDTTARALLEELIATMFAALGEPAFNTHVAEGAALTLDQVVAMALADEPGIHLTQSDAVSG